MTTSQLRETGLEPQHLARLVRDGVLRRVFTGVYCPAQVADSLELRAQCAALALPDHCVVVDRSAAWLHGVDLHDPNERFSTPDLEMVALRGHTPPRRPGIYTGERDLEARDLTTVEGIPVTTPIRTALDIACLRGEHRALAALDAFMRQHHLTEEEMMREAVRLKGRRGVVQLRRLIPLASGKADSTGESWLRATILRAELPVPVLQFEVHVDGRLFAILDLAYPGLKIAIEYDGEEFHGADQAHHDSARRERLRELGWLVIVVRKHQLSGNARDAWLKVLTRAISERDAPRGKRVYPRGLPFSH